MVWLSRKDNGKHFTPKPKKALVGIKSSVESKGIIQHKFLKQNDESFYYNNGMSLRVTKEKGLSDRFLVHKDDKYGTRTYEKNGMIIHVSPTGGQIQHGNWQGCSLCEKDHKDKYLKRNDSENKFFEIYIHNTTNGKKGGKFIEAPSKEYAIQHPQKYVGKGVKIEGISDEIKAKSMNDVVDNYNRKNGIDVVDGVRYYKNHKNCLMCKMHFKH